MARVQTSRFAGRKGATLKCGKCGRDIPKGEVYRWFTLGFRSKNKIIRCFRSECTPKQSETDTSKMSGVWAAVETATADLNALMGAPGVVSDIESILLSAADSINDVAQEYRDAADASPTGLVFGEDLNEKADTIESGASELDSWQPDPDMDDAEPCELHTDDAIGDGPEQYATEVDLAEAREGCDACKAERDNKWDEIVTEAIDILEGASFE